MACATTAAFASRILSRAHPPVLRRAAAFPFRPSSASSIGYRSDVSARSAVSPRLATARGPTVATSGARARVAAAPPACPRPPLPRARSSLIPHAAQDATATKGSVETHTDMSDDARKTLKHAADRYGGVIVDPACLPDDIEMFADSLHASVVAWKEQGVRGVWLQIPITQAHLVGAAASAEFEFHHAEKTHVMMTRWLPGALEENHLPPNASHQVGIGAFVVNGEGKVLLVQEKRGPAAASSRPNFWKLPTGLVEQGEDVPDAATREVFEETGVRTEFVSVLGIRHGHNAPFGKSDMFFLCALKIADGQQTHPISVQEAELAAAEWRDATDAFESEHIEKGSHMDHMYALCAAHAKGEYDGMGFQALPAGFGREGTVVTYSNAKSTEEGKAKA
jgi:ADP-ribose pyrophosphatase YjhB (NUDIX family)